MVFKAKKVDQDQEEGEQDIPAPKAKKEKKVATKKHGPKLLPNNLAAPPAGHNSGETNPAVVEILDEIMASKERVKTEGKLQRDCRNRLKTEFGILSSVTAHEIRMRTLDPDVRIQFESGCADIKVMTGYQFAMDLKKDTVARTEEEFVDPANKSTVETIQRQG